MLNMCLMPQYRKDGALLALSRNNKQRYPSHSGLCVAASLCQELGRVRRCLICFHAIVAPSHLYHAIVTSWFLLQLV